MIESALQFQPTDSFAGRNAFRVILLRSQHQAWLPCEEHDCGLRFCLSLRPTLPCFADGLQLNRHFGRSVPQHVLCHTTGHRTLPGKAVSSGEIPESWLLRIFRQHVLCVLGGLSSCTDLYAASSSGVHGFDELDQRRGRRLVRDRCRSLVCHREETF